jgi:hypothetical protein
MPSSVGAYPEVRDDAGSALELLFLPRQHRLLPLRPLFRLTLPMQPTTHVEALQRRAVRVELIVVKRLCRAVSLPAGCSLRATTYDKLLGNALDVGHLGGFVDGLQEAPASRCFAGHCIGSRRLAVGL